MTAPRKTRPVWEAEIDGKPPAVEPHGEVEITQTKCRRCGTEISGLNGRYACGTCGWNNHWSEGHNTLPTAVEDPDFRG
jgi:ribosomal protein S27AE